MYKVDVRRAFDLLMPRWNTANSWNHEGKFGMHNLPKLPKHIDKLLKKVMVKYDRAAKRPEVERVDVSGDNVWTIQRTLKVATLQYLFRRDFEWQVWRTSRLPILIRYAGKLVVWNGTHRTVLARLAGKKLRARVIDLDEFIRWSRTASAAERSGVKRVINFGARKYGDKTIARAAKILKARKGRNHGKRK